MKFEPHQCQAFLASLVHIHTTPGHQLLPSGQDGRQDETSTETVATKDRLRPQRPVRVDMYLLLPFATLQGQRRGPQHLCRHTISIRHADGRVVLTTGHAP